MTILRAVKLLILSAIISAFLIAPSAFAKKDEPLKLSTQLSKTKGTIGDVFELTLTINYGSKIKLVEPIKLRAEGLTIQAGKKTPPVQKGSRSVEERVFKLTSFDTGDYKIEPLVVGYIDPAGKEGTVTDSQTYKIKIESVLKNVNERTDIRDIKGVLNIEPRYEKYLRIFYWTLMALAALVITNWVRKKFQKKEPMDVSYLLTPTQEAIKRLEALKNSNLLRDGQIKFYYLELTGIIRRFIERKYAVSTEELTTYELSLKVRDFLAPEDLKEKIIRFFEACDLVKFANYRPMLEAIKVDHAAALEIVTEATRETLNPQEVKDEAHK